MVDGAERTDRRFLRPVDVELQQQMRRRLGRTAKPAATMKRMNAPLGVERRLHLLRAGLPERLNSVRSVSRRWTSAGKRRADRHHALLARRRRRLKILRDAREGRPGDAPVSPDTLQVFCFNNRRTVRRSAPLRHVARALMRAVAAPAQRTPDRGQGELRRILAVRGDRASAAQPVAARMTVLFWARLAPCRPRRRSRRLADIAP